MSAWHDFERTAVRPVEKLAKAIAKELDRNGEGLVDPDAREIERNVLAHLEMYAEHWHTDASTIRKAIAKPDADLAKPYLGTVKSMRERAQQDGRASPDADPRWRQVASQVQEHLTERYSLRKTDLRAVLAASAGQSVACIGFRVGGEPIGWIARKRLLNELRTLPDDTEWRTERNVWIATWKGGKGRLR